MRKLRHIAFIFAVVLGLTFSVSAQKGPKGGRPPKENQPTIDPKTKPPRGNPPKGEKPGKPGMAYYLVLKDRDEYFG